MLIPAILRFYDKQLKSREALPSDDYGVDVIPAPWFAQTKASIEIVLNDKGNIKSINEIDLPKEIVPYVGRTSNVLPRFSCDNITYLTQEKRFAAFVECHEKYMSVGEMTQAEGFLKFLSSYTCAEIQAAFEKHGLAECMKDPMKPNVVFRLPSGYLHRMVPVVKRWQEIARLWHQMEMVEGIDILTGSMSQVSKMQPKAFASLKLFSDNKCCTGHYGLPLVASTNFETTLKITKAMEALKYDKNHCLNFYDENLGVCYWTVCGKKSTDIIHDLLMNGERQISQDVFKKTMQKWQSLTLNQEQSSEEVHVLVLKTPAKGHVQIVSYDHVRLDVFTNNVIKYSKLFLRNFSTFYRDPKGIPSAFCIAEIMGKLRSNRYEVFKTLLNFVAYKKPLPKWFYDQLFHSILKAEWAAKNGKRYELGVLCSLLFTLIQLDTNTEEGTPIMVKDNPVYDLGKLVALNECLREKRKVKIGSLTRKILVNPSRHFSQVNAAIETSINDIERKNAGLGRWLKKMWGGIFAELAARELPVKTTNNDRNAFFFGYHDFRNEFYKSKEQKATDKLKASIDNEA